MDFCAQAADYLMIRDKFEDAWRPCQSNTDCKSGLVCTQKPIQYTAISSPYISAANTGLFSTQSPIPGNTVSPSISATSTGLFFTKEPIRNNTISPNISATSSNNICVCPQYGMTIHILNACIAKPFY